MLQYFRGKYSKNLIHIQPVDIAFSCSYNFQKRKIIRNDSDAEISSKSNFSRCIFGPVYTRSSISSISIYISFWGVIPDVWNGDPRLCKLSHQKGLFKNVHNSLFTKTEMWACMLKNNFFLSVNAKKKIFQL